MRRIEDIVTAIPRELADVCRRLDYDAMAELADAVQACAAVFVAGAGRSGLMARAGAMRLMHFGKRVYVVGETVTPAIGPDDLLLVASGSGETGGMILAARKARSVGARVALVTGNWNSTLAGIADLLVVVRAPSPGLGEAASSPQPMGNLFEQSLLLVLDAVVMALMARTGTTSEEMFTRHANLE